eukprot:557499-Pelagomonas_calceolata.AAC.1
MEPAQKGFHVYEEEEGRDGIPLDGPPLYGDVFCNLTSRETDSGVCLLVKVFYCHSDTVSMVSVGKPRSYMIQSSLSWSVVLKAE